MKWFPALLILIVGAVWGWRQHETRGDLAQQVARLKPMAEEAVALAARNAVGRSVALETNELERLRRDHQELLRLRGEMGSLRERGRLTEENLQQRIREARTETEAVQREIELVTARKKAADLSKETLDTLSSYAHLVKEVARSSGVGVPRSWDEVNQALDRTWLPDGKRSPERMQRIQKSLRSMLSLAAAEPIPPAAFEFMPVASGIDPGQVNAGRLPLLRECRPRPRPDGGWSRAYAFLNGEVREAISESGDFTEWEAKARGE